MDKTRRETELGKMERVWRIFTHPFYIQNLKENKKCEKERIFCKHDVPHFLDVARLAYILKLERGYQVEKELIYAAALLHDIGKWKQYEQKIPHEVSSAEIAEDILKASGFDEQERTYIIRAIRGHRKGTEAGELAEILYDADKLSRPCFACEAEKECNWSEEKKNKRIGW